MALGLLSSAMTGLGTAFGGAAGGPRITTVSPEVQASISAPFAVGRGASATSTPAGAGDFASASLGGVGFLALGAVMLVMMARR